MLLPGKLPVDFLTASGLPWDIEENKENPVPLGGCRIKNNNDSNSNNNGNNNTRDKSIKSILPNQTHIGTELLLESAIVSPEHLVVVLQSFHQVCLLLAEIKLYYLSVLVGFRRQFLIEESNERF